MPNQTNKPPESHARRIYEKGERRHKYVGKADEPTIEFDNGDPKKWIGKCPATLSAADREHLLNEAIAAPNGDRELSAPKKLYVVHEGAIYEAQTSDRGRSYHGYPYKGRLSADLVNSLKAMAARKLCVKKLDALVKRYIDLQGGR